MITEAQTEVAQLPLEFDGTGEVKGYRFRQLFHRGEWYIYEVSRKQKVSHYEVFRAGVTKASPPYQMADKINYPKSPQFGLTAWTAKTLHRAEEIMSEKVNSRNERAGIH